MPRSLYLIRSKITNGFRAAGLGENQFLIRINEEANSDVWLEKRNIDELMPETAVEESTGDEFSVVPPSQGNDEAAFTGEASVRNTSIQNSNHVIVGANREVVAVQTQPQKGFLGIGEKTGTDKAMDSQQRKGYDGEDSRDGANLEIRSCYVHKSTNRDLMETLDAWKEVLQGEREAFEVQSSVP
ncbi:hypothetical protein Ancab_005129 [Ancistrocladus abbreviatus]